MIGNNTSSRFGHDGWDPPDGHGEFDGKGEGGGGGSGHGPYRFKLPEPDKNPIESGKPARKRVMIVGAPFYMWEHSTYKFPNVPRGVFTAICLRQGNMGGECPLCTDKRWPSYGAYFTVIDMGFVRYTAGGVTLLPDVWTDKQDGKRRESQFNRRLMVAKKGGKDNPGQLAYFEDQRNRRGDLTGCVFDTLRNGAKKSQIGDSWEFVTRVGNSTPPSIDEMRNYLIGEGADPERMGKEWALQRFTTADMEQSVLYPAEEMARWIGVSAPAQGGGQSGTRVEGAGYERDYRGGPNADGEWD